MSQESNVDLKQEIAKYEKAIASATAGHTTAGHGAGAYRNKASSLPTNSGRGARTFHFSQHRSGRGSARGALVGTASKNKWTRSNEVGLQIDAANKESIDITSNKGGIQVSDKALASSEKVEAINNVMPPRPTQPDSARHHAEMQAQQPTLKKSGKHKLILSSKEAEHDSATAACPKINVNYNKKPKKTHPRNAMIVKRIQLNPAPAPDIAPDTDTNTSNTTNVPPPSTSQEQSTADVKTATSESQVRLTDFAYRVLPAPQSTSHTSAAGTSVSSMTYNRSVEAAPKPSTQPQRATRALVRVKPGEDPQRMAPKKGAPTSSNGSDNDKFKNKFVRTTSNASDRPETKAEGNATAAKKTQICPAVLSGEECANVHCTKRHDIPRNMATPICTFFQRKGGQCRKGDACRFLHVKVNPRAQICPVFSTYGYCDAGESCPMKHIRMQQQQQQERKSNV